MEFPLLPYPSSSILLRLLQLSNNILIRNAYYAGP